MIIFIIQLLYERFISIYSVRGDALQKEIEYLQNQTKSIEVLASLSRFSGMDSLLIKFMCATGTIYLVEKRI
jgi:hypothetical protein